MKTFKEHVDHILTQDLGVNVKYSDEKDFEKIIKQLSKVSEDTWLDKKVFLRSIAKFFRDSSNISKDKREKLLDLVLKEIEK